MTARPIKRRGAKPAKATPIAVRVGRPPIPDPPDVKPVQVYGAFIDSVTIVSKTIASLLILPGRLGESDAEERPKALVPFAEVRLGGEPIKERVEEGVDEDPPTLFQMSLPLENLAYLLLDLTSDIKRICYEICSMGQSDLAIDPARMAHVRYFMAHLERQARLCRVRLDHAYGEPEADGTTKGT